MISSGKIIFYVLETNVDEDQRTQIEDDEWINLKTVLTYC
jgi:hypothetical protein